jgi:hypothetical protein
MEQAAKPGLGIEECVTRLKRFHYAFKRLHEILTAKITSEPIYELKTAFSYHAYLCAEHVSALRTRVGEMREPPLGLEDIPHEALQIFFDEILCAPTTFELLVGLYETALPALTGALQDYMQVTNPLSDAPSNRVCRYAGIEIQDMLKYGREAIACLEEPGVRQTLEPWSKYLSELLQIAGGLGGSRPTLDQPCERRYSQTPYVYDAVPKRDERFQDLYNQGVNPEAFLYDKQYPAKPKALMMLFKRIREIDVPEMMASIIIQTPGKPWGYYLEMSRQLWDEARHAMMGEVGFVAMGVDWTQARITHNWSLRLNTECKPLERHGVLYFIEQGLMPKTGKRYEFETAAESGIPLMKTIQDFDWADEVLHAAIGRRWYITQFKDIHEALAFGDQCWSKIVSNWKQVKETGLTEHTNWWPSIYKQACAKWGEDPNPAVLAYNTTYEDKRADLKDLTRA